MQSADVLERLDDAPLKRVHWEWTLIAALGDYLDAGSIVAGGASLLAWITYFHLSLGLIGIIGALGSNGISTGIGAFVGGRLGDIYGRKFIYGVDLIIFSIGTLPIIFAVNAPMVIIGYILMGLAVGADVPTSWSLIAEFAPRKARGKLMGLTNVFWYIGPIVILLLSLAFLPLGILGARLVFASLLVVSVITYLLRRRLVESPRWSYLVGKGGYVEDAIESVGERANVNIAAAPQEKSRYRDLFTKSNLKAFLFVIPIYLFWGFPAGTYGFFLPFIFKTLGAQTAAGGDFLQMLWFGSAIITVLFVFMPFNDRVDRRLLYAISAFCCALAFLILVFLPITNPIVAIANVLLFGLGQGIGLWPLQRVWSVELFPTKIRNTAQGTLWGVMRVIFGIWSLYVPIITAALGFNVLAILFGCMFLYNMIVGGLFGPRTQSKSLEQIQAEETSAVSGASSL
jgi:inositol transporter-like SP family MFS transporter